MAGHGRFFVDPEALTGDEVTLTGQLAHQIGRVLRLEPNDRITLLDGSGDEIEARILYVSRDSVRAQIIGRSPSETEPHLKLTLAVCLPKNDKIDLIVQKCTELGASEFVIARSERTVARLEGERLASRLERWGRIATEAAEQSERAKAPDVRGIIAFDELVRSIPHYDLALIAWEEETAVSLHDALNPAVETAATKARSRPAPTPDSVLADVPGHHCPSTTPDVSGHPCPETMLLIIGPEGGLTEREVASAVDAGAIKVSLGKRLLRVETAAIAACAVVMAEMD